MKNMITNWVVNDTFSILDPPKSDDWLRKSSLDSVMEGADTWKLVQEADGWVYSAEGESVFNSKCGCLKSLVQGI